ncbi:DUF4442 domain-containing protein [Olivibacter domesticus]|uniref:Acyl-coenzyme A thioesterase PaaI, contains HGG motif n=1 Tax=Olivibacter domesticus TaxID=407022 RepID=A0A1H7HWL6_OLID1|nr:DUF4442 domain-containing protein [Olivibacter domesticus]SEK53982.1 protein of unknown function [Olivibacter domesticus]
MKVSERTLKWVMRLYPPLLFQRIWVKKFHKGFKGVDVKIVRSILNRNYNASIFGGTIYAASDPFFALLFDQIFKRKGYKTRVWLKSASIDYIKPGRTSLYFQIKITEKEIDQAKNDLDNLGKFIKKFPMEIKDSKGVLCAQVINEVYVRNLKYRDEQPTIAY